MSDLIEADSSRLFTGPRTVQVYVPPPVNKAGMILSDLPPGQPPVVQYMGVEATYWAALEEGSMPYAGGRKVFSEEVMDWMRSIEPAVERLL